MVEWAVFPLRHDPDNPAFNAHVRQLSHAGCGISADHRAGFPVHGARPASQSNKTPFGIWRENNGAPEAQDSGPARKARSRGVTRRGALCSGLWQHCLTICAPCSTLRGVSSTLPASACNELETSND